MTAVAVYARVLDGDHLWLAVPAPTGETLAVRGGPDGELPVPTEHRDGLAVARLDVAALLGGVDADKVVLTFALDGETVTWDGGPMVGPTKVPPTRDGRWQLRAFAADGELRVARTRADAACVVDGIEHDGDVVTLGLSIADGVLVALDESTEIGRVAVVDGRAVLDASLVVPDGVVARLAVRSGDLDVPVVRRERDLKRANFAVVLPATAGGRLQWQPDGQLAIAGGAGA
ncbi:hypothetical protein NPS01_14000 [Nocardioides psychrotolerans]|uniref:Uncharacterized protein n=1 Tax=Nocardioides psychrotolerans TaxID=1005945 RepID=A0A1I3H5Z6_9ACTN|nr:hypothetical protein [Nocardioides psychrotolerans]GEP37737.1 hypothetical protein NPS01_14000 [Nocardioides psychrotolerans]SFI31059.1 hypothetical protein SAMN05216561_10745 [Nocardioides psychrotolerans]